MTVTGSVIDQEECQVGDTKLFLVSWYENNLGTLCAAKSSDVNTLHWFFTLCKYFVQVKYSDNCCHCFVLLAWCSVITKHNCHENMSVLHKWNIYSIWCNLVAGNIECSVFKLDNVRRRQWLQHAHAHTHTHTQIRGKLRECGNYCEIRLCDQNEC